MCVLLKRFDCLFVLFLCGLFVCCFVCVVFVVVFCFLCLLFVVCCLLCVVCCLLVVHGLWFSVCRLRLAVSC